MERLYDRELVTADELLVVMSQSDQHIVQMTAVPAVADRLDKLSKNSSTWNLFAETAARYPMQITPQNLDTMVLISSSPESTKTVRKQLADAYKARINLLWALCWTTRGKEFAENRGVGAFQTNSCIDVVQQDTRRGQKLLSGFATREFLTCIDGCTQNCDCEIEDESSADTDTQRGDRPLSTHLEQIDYVCPIRGLTELPLKVGKIVTK